jgi:hypothetical protein
VHGHESGCAADLFGVDERTEASQDAVRVQLLDPRKQVIAIDVDPAVFEGSCCRPEGSLGDGKSTLEGIDNCPVFAC